MTRTQFEKSLKQMCKALGVSMNKYQVELFWDEFKHKNDKDFAAACVFCGRGTPGKLPFQNVFGDSITAAMEMRFEEEKVKRNEEAERTFSGNAQASKELLTTFSDFREWDPPFTGKNEFEKGQIISKELFRKTKEGEAIYWLEPNMFFAYWAEPIPVEQKKKYGKQLGNGWWSKTISKDKALVRNYEHTPKPATLFGNIGRGMKDE